MKIAYIGNFEPEYSTENDVRKAFEHLGHDVFKIQENKPFVLNVEAFDLILITSTWDTAIPLNTWLNYMHWAAEKGIPTATLHLDTFWGKTRRDRKWWLNPMFHTAYIFTADGDYDKEWKAFGKNHIWLPPAVRHDACYFGKFREEYACDVAFIGSNGQGYHDDVWPYRKELLAELWTMCRSNGWTFKNPGGDMPKISRGEDMNDFYASAKVTVGDSLCLKKEDSKYWSDRVPECLGRGGFLIMPEIDELDVMYEGRLDMYEWGDFEMLELKIKSYLHNETIRRRKQVKLQKLVEMNDTYVNRVQTILKEVGL